MHSGGQLDGLLSLLTGYKNNPDAFIRPGPPPAPPLPLRVTCKACGADVGINDSRCRSCGVAWRKRGKPGEEVNP